MMDQQRKMDRTIPPPLVVDLDGTLVRGDTLIEGLLLLIRTRPAAIVELPFWLRFGKAGFKQRVADRVVLDPATLAYDERLLEKIREEARQRHVVLCSAADVRIVEAVANHLQCFDSVLATSGARNLSGQTKADALVSQYGEKGFDYAANSAVDVPVFRRARRAWLINPTAALLRKKRSLENVELTFPNESGGIRDVWRALRPIQWIKNLLVFVPLLATIQINHLEVLLTTMIAFVAFSLVASCIYLLNDLLDLQDDRLHPRKRRRPLASGALAPTTGLLLAVLTLTTGLGTAIATSRPLAGMLIVYFVSAMLYSLWLKRVPLMDTIVLASLYTLRILAGAAAISVVPSVWLLAFSMFFFLSLALAKRHSEMVELDGMSMHSAIPGREYRREDLQILIAQGTASGYSAVLVLALYIDSDAVRRQYNHPEIIWLVCPLLLYWINKLWLNSQRREIEDEPLIWAMTNRVSRTVAVISAALLMAARWVPKHWS